jgi:hypothetical protein
MGQLDDEEQIELERLAKEYAKLENDKKYWQGEVSKENEPEETSKSFGEADLDWIASVTGIDYKYREWTSFTLDEDFKPSTDFKKVYENLSRAFHMRTAAGRRIFINLFFRHCSATRIQEFFAYFP